MGLFMIIRCLLITTSLLVIQFSAYASVPFEESKDHTAKSLPVRPDETADKDTFFQKLSEQTKQFIETHNSPAAHKLLSVLESLLDPEILRAFGETYPSFQDISRSSAKEIMTKVEDLAFPNGSFVKLLPLELTRDIFNEVYT